MIDVDDGGRFRKTDRRKLWYMEQTKNVEETGGETYVHYSLRKEAHAEALGEYAYNLT